MKEEGEEKEQEEGRGSEGGRRKEEIGEVGKEKGGEECDMKF